MGDEVLVCFVRCFTACLGSFLSSSTAMWGLYYPFLGGKARQEVRRVFSLSLVYAVLTLFFRGLNNPPKRAKIFSHLRDLNADILFKQETHIKHTEASKLWCSWTGQIFQSTFSAKARGVAILIKNNIPFQHISTKSDPNGPFIIVTGKILTVYVTLLILYAPNFDNAGFFSEVFA